MTRFEKVGTGEAAPEGTAPKRKKSHLRTAEEMVADSKHADGPQTPMDRKLLQDHIQHQADYKSRARAEYLMSMDVVRAHSPSERLTLDVKENDPYSYHWCNERRRQRIGAGMDGWVPVTDMEEAKRLCGSSHLREEGGKIMSGDLFLCKRPREISEQRAALHYQRSQRNLKAAARGVAPATKTRADGTQEFSESFSDIERSTASVSDPGVRMTGRIKVSEPED